MSHSKAVRRLVTAQSTDETYRRKIREMKIDTKEGVSGKVGGRRTHNKVLAALLSTAAWCQQWSKILPTCRELALYLEMEGQWNKKSNKGWRGEIWWERSVGLWVWGLLSCLDTNAEPLRRERAQMSLGWRRKVNTWDPRLSHHLHPELRVFALPPLFFILGVPLSKEIGNV